jgi:hypothetical protein
MYPQISRVVAGATACIALCVAAPAAAEQRPAGRTADGGQVLLVGGGKDARRSYEPQLPARADAGLGREPAARASASRTGATRPAARSAAKLRFGKRGRRAVLRSLAGARRSKRITRTQRVRYRRFYVLARTRARRLGGTRGRELASVVSTVEAIAIRRGLNAARMPALFLILRRNAEFWPRSPLPSPRGTVQFRGSEMLFEYYPGSGLQLQPLVNFKLANNLHGACVKQTDIPCDRGALRSLLRELVRTSARRGGFRTWEYYFEFGGGRPPWISGMAQATAIQAFGRASELLGKSAYRGYAQEAMAAFETRAPVGVLTDGPLGGPHYLQYSFAPSLYITNALLQTVIGLYDYTAVTGDKRARRLWRAVEPEARAELVASDTGSWSTYSYRGAESTREYHELLREFAASLCSRLRHDTYCDTAERFERYVRRRDAR